MQAIIAFIDANRQRFVDELAEWVRLPSVSSEPIEALLREALSLLAK